MPAQFARPIADSSAGLWTPTPLRDHIDEEVPGDDDVIRSSPNPQDDSFTIIFAPVTDPNTPIGHILRYRYRKDAPGGSGQINLTIILMQGLSQEIASWTHTNIPAEWTTAVQTLTDPQADSIENYEHLRFRFIGTQV